MYDSSYKWIRGVRAKVWRHTEELPQRTQGASRSHLQRVPLPTFSGEAEDWPEFRRYRLCKVVGVKIGEDGQVRSCEVALRPRRKGEDHGERYQHKKLATLTVGVQRIAVILPVEEQEGEEGGRSQLQEEPGSEEDSHGPEEESRRCRTTQVNDEPVQGRANPRGGRAPAKGTATEELQKVVNSDSRGRVKQCSHKSLCKVSVSRTVARHSHSRTHPSRKLVPKY